MKHRVLKCELDFHTTQKLHLPAEAEILSVQCPNFYVLHVFVKE